LVRSADRAERQCLLKSDRASCRAAFATWESLCKKAPAYCARAGNLAWMANVASASRSQELLRDGCARGDDGSCASAASRVLFADAPGSVEDALLQADRTCQKGEWLGCQTLATELELGRHVPRDVPRAVKTLEYSCLKIEDGAACIDAGRLTITEWGAAEAARARTSFDEACRLGFDEGCFRRDALDAKLARP